MGILKNKEHCAKFRKSLYLLGVFVLSVLFITACLVRDMEPAQLTISHYDVASIASEQQYVYIAVVDEGVFAISRENNKVVWRFPNTLSPDSFEVGEARILPDKDLLYFNNGKRIFALDAITGTFLWELPLESAFPSQISWLSAPDILLVANSNSGSVSLIHAPQGEEAWIFTLPLPENYDIRLLSISQYRVVMVVGNIYEDTGSRLSQGQLYVISIASGELLWTRDLADWITLSSIPVPAAQDVDENVYLVVGSDMLAFDGFSGVEQWHAHWISAYNELILIEDQLVAVGRMAMFAVERLSGEIVCRQTFHPFRDPNDFLAQDNQHLYFVHHDLEWYRILWWQTSKAFNKSYIYVTDVDNCNFDLYADVSGYLLTYDPVMRSGMIIPSHGKERRTVREIQVRP